MANAAAAAHALDLLDVLAHHSAPMPASALARELGLPRSTVYHLLTVLRDRGYVVHLREQRRYGLGAAAFALGSAYTRREPLRWVAATVLTRLVRESTHNGHFAVLHGSDTLYVIEERASDRPSLVTDVGVRLPAQLTASGLAMVAALSPPQLRALWPDRRALVRRNGAGPSSLTELGQRLAGVRAAGYAEEEGLVTAGFASVACAVLDHDAHPVAAVALTFPSQEVDEAQRARLADQVVAAAAEVAHHIRGQAPSAEAAF